MQLRIHFITAQILTIVITYLADVDESNGTSETSKFNTIPPTLFPLLTTLTVTALSG
jgi:hypothetical protein